MKSNPNTAQCPDDARAPRQAWPMRLWLALPHWVFRVFGAVVFFGLVAQSIPAYLAGFWQHGAHYEFQGGFTLWIPWRILVDITFLLIALAFCFRLPARSRAARPVEVFLPLVAAFWPLLPFLTAAPLRLLQPDWATAYDAFLWDRAKWAGPIFLCGTALIVVGNLIDVSGYATLFRSVSIAAEARELKVTGLYRIVRHPIYLGQILAQAGVWLFYARTHVVWITFYATFVAMQLYRSRIEDRVLERAFGEPYLTWKRRTFWFV